MSKRGDKRKRAFCSLPNLQAENKDILLGWLGRDAVPVGRAVCCYGILLVLTPFPTGTGPDRASQLLPLVPDHAQPGQFVQGAIEGGGGARSQAQTGLVDLEQAEMNSDSQEMAGMHLIICFPGVP